MKKLSQYISDHSNCDSANAEPLDERFVNAAIVSSKLNAWKKQVHKETDAQKQLALIASMVHVGIGMIALVLDKGKRK